MPDTPVYNNGADGVGATLTSAANADLNVGDRVLVKDQGAEEQNGIYVVTSLGAAGGGGEPWILTRANDADTGAEFNGGATVELEEGGVNARSRWSLAKNSGWIDGAPAGSEPNIGSATEGILVFFKTPSFSLGDVGVPTALNKNETPSATAGDESATGIRLAAQPFMPSAGVAPYIKVDINGIGYVLGDGVKAGVDCYFSLDAGTTPATLAGLVGGDPTPANNHELIWNGTTAGFEPDNNDRVDLHYPASNSA